MSHINVEIKARCGDQEKIRKILRERDANFKGTDHQIDTYFNVSNGRLKLREGNIENFLIYYERENIAGPKQSNVTLYAVAPQSSLKGILEKVLGVSVVVGYAAWKFVPPWRTTFRVRDAMGELAFSAERGGDPDSLNLQLAARLAELGVRMDADSIRRAMSRPERSVYGHAQEAWLRDRLEQSVQAGKPWQVIGNQVVMAHTTGADIAGFLGKEGWARAFAQVTPILRPWLEQLATLPSDVPFEFDGWDSYPAARARMDRMFVETGSRPLVLSGDSHAFWVNELHDAQDRRVAAELGVTAITSSSLGNMLGDVELGPAFSKACPEVRFCQHLTKGYGLVTLRPDAARIDLIGVTTVLERNYERFVLKSYRVPANPTGGVSAIEEI